MEDIARSLTILKKKIFASPPPQIVTLLNHVSVDAQYTKETLIEQQKLS